jgi:DNA-directed RNA polymerase specialized sigma24 family protein
MRLVRLLNIGEKSVDSESIKELYEKYYKEIYIYTVSLCQNHAVAEDIVSEALLR